MGAVIKARGGERIVLTEYPKGYLDAMNARLDALAEVEDETTVEATA